jgi:hypothetical protein
MDRARASMKPGAIVFFGARPSWANSARIGARTKG